MSSSADSSAGEPEARARQKVRALWQPGSLFHVTRRRPRKQGPPIDRLAGILKMGLVAPAQCRDGTVRSDLNLLVTGCSVPYDNLVFLHRFGPVSYLYTMCDPGRIAIFVDPSLPVLNPEAMDDNWPLLCQDEVYVQESVAPERLIGVAIHPADADSILGELLADFRRLAIPLYDYDGTVLWPT